jgi:hypothetical protein
MVHKVQRNILPGINYSIWNKKTNMFSRHRTCCVDVLPARMLLSEYKLNIVIKEVVIIPFKVVRIIN